MSAVEGRVYVLDRGTDDPFDTRAIRVKVLAIRANTAGVRFVQYRMLRDDGEFGLFGPSSTPESVFLKCWLPAQGVAA